MRFFLHNQAATTPKVRAAIEASDGVGTALAACFGVTPQTVYKGRKRDGVEDSQPHAASASDDADTGAGGRRRGAAHVAAGVAG